MARARALREPILNDPELPIDSANGLYQVSAFCILPSSFPFGWLPVAFLPRYYFVSTSLLHRHIWLAGVLPTLLHSLKKLLPQVSVWERVGSPWFWRFFVVLAAFWIGIAFRMPAILGGRRPRRT